jgi:hypothetical protein
MRPVTVCQPLARSFSGKTAHHNLLCAALTPHSGAPLTGHRLMRRIHSIVGFSTAILLCASTAVGAELPVDSKAPDSQTASSPAVDTTAQSSVDARTAVALTASPAQAITIGPMSTPGDQASAVPSASEPVATAGTFTSLQPELFVANDAVTSKLIVEFGVLDPLRHRIQFGRNGTQFDYVKRGGQDVLFPTTRLSVEGSYKRRHSLVFLYQPIDIQTRETLRQDLLVDNVRFPAGTPVDFRYGFDFYRISYLYNFLSHRRNDELSLGATLQLRNAIIDFTSADGLLRRSNRDVGPVPALKSRGRWHVSERAWLGYEVDGMYAPVRYINGGKSDVVGAIVDLSLRAGYNVAPPVGVFANVRYLGGGATGTSKSDAARDDSDGYTSNWLHFLTTTVGVEVKLERMFSR